MGWRTLGHARARGLDDDTDPALPCAADDLLDAHRHLRLDNQSLDATAAAERIATWLTRA